MSELHIPLSSGAHEEADPKILPQGRLLRVNNARIRKDGKIGARYGYVRQTSPSSNTAIGSAAVDDGAVTIWSRTVRSVPLYNVRTSATSKIAVSTPALSELTAPTRLATTHGSLQYGALAGDAAIIGTNIYVAVVDGDPRDASKVGKIRIDELDLAGRHTGWSTTVGTNPAANVKLCVLGGILYVFYTDITTAYVQLLSVNPTTHVRTVINSTVAAVPAGCNFDARALNGALIMALFDGTSHIYVYSVATATGLLTTLHTVTISGATAFPSICYSTGYHELVLVYFDGSAAFAAGDVYAQSWTWAGASALPNTLLNTGVGGFPVVENWMAGRFMAIWGHGARITPALVPYGSEICAFDDVATNVLAPGVVPATRPFAGPNSEMLVWTVDRTSLADGIPGTYWLLELGAGAPVHRVGSSCALEAMPKKQEYFRCDPRASVIVTSDVPSKAIAYLPTYLGERYGCDLVTLEMGQKQSAKLNGQTFFSGARLHVFDGDVLTADGLLSGPTVVRVDDGTAGSITAGTYQYVAIWEWTDAQGRKYRSAPSVPLSKTYSGAWHLSNVDVTPYDGQVTTSAGGWLTGETDKRGVSCVVYRTVKDGTIFYRLPTKATASALGPGYTVVVDDYFDADIIAQEVLYTQGERGGASGLLANDSPPPCRYICAGNDRLMVGGLERRDEVRWSKLVFPGEPVQWSEDVAFRARLPDIVTGVAFLDGAWYAWTADAVYQIAGDGPDDTGAGYFSEARRIPSEVGCAEPRSLVSMGAGILFRAKNDRIYQLPRGGCTPEWVSQQMREELALYPYITGAVVVPAQNAIVFGAYSDSTHGALFWYDVRVGEWYVDELDFAVYNVCTFGDALLVNGQILETVAAYFDSPDGSDSYGPIEYTIVTGDIRPFGPIGQGRTRKVVLLGEWRGICVVTIYVSYDSGQSWGDYATFTFSSSGTMSVGDPIELEHRLKYVRGCAYRFKIVVSCGYASTRNAGVTLSALSFELFQSPGTKRLQASRIVG